MMEEERTVTITLDEYRELIAISERYYILKAMHSNDTYLPKEDKVLYATNEKSESEG